MNVAPTYIANAGMNSSNGATSRTLYLPSGFATGQIIIVSAQAEGAAFDINTPDGYTIITSWTQGGDSYGAWYWRRLDGTESTGDRSVTRTSNSGLFSICASSWLNAEVTGTPFETVALAQGTSKTASTTAITPSKNYCSVIALISVEDNYTVATMSGGNFAENYDLQSGAGNGCTFACDSFGQGAAALEAARTSAINSASNENWCVLTLAMYPVTGWAEKVNGVFPSKNSKINGVLRTSIAKVVGA